MKMKYSILIVCLLVSAVSGAQTTKILNWEGSTYVPASYLKSTLKYPAIIEVDTSTASGLHGVQAYLKQGWNGSVSGIEFLVFSLKAPKGATANDVLARVENIKGLYRIYYTALIGYKAQEVKNIAPLQVQSTVIVNKDCCIDYFFGGNGKAPAKIVSETIYEKFLNAAMVVLPIPEPPAPIPPQVGNYTSFGYDSKAKVLSAHVPKDISYKLHYVFGLVWSKGSLKAGNNEINLKGFPRGNYTIKLDNNQQYSFKIK